MSTTAIKNAAPRFLFSGIDDTSQRQQPVTPLAVPTHLPLVLPRSSWGPEDDQIVDGNNLKALYGDDIFDRRAPFFTHQNLLAEGLTSAPNQIMVCRMVPDDAPAPAGLTLWADYVEDDIPNYSRNADGHYNIGADGNPVLDPLAPTVPGHRVRLYTTPLKSGRVGLQVQGSGQLVSNRDGTSGIAVPILDLQRPFRGSRGNWGGVRLTAPNVNSVGGTRDDLIEDQRAMLYRFQAMERTSERGSPVPKATITGDQSVMFSFKDDFYDYTAKADFGISRVLMQAYNAKNADGLPATYGVFSDYHVYQSNLETMLKALHALELPFGTVGTTADDFHMVNFLTNIGYLGYPYHSIAVEGPATGGLLFTEATVHYAQGGGDGTLTDAQYESDVQAFIDGFMDNPARLWDPFRCPQSVLYDIGFGLETKLRLPKLLGYRDDMYLVMSTQVYGQPTNTEAQDYSIGVALQNELMQHPESVLSGTGTCRAIIIGHAGPLPAARVRHDVPLTYKFAVDCAAYMGAADGVWTTAKRPDEPGNNVVKGFTELNARAKTDQVVDNFWKAGIVWAQYKNRRDQFVPVYQTVYSDDTSVLNGAINMIIAVDIIKVCRGVWTELVGIQGLTQARFIQRSNRLIAQRVTNKYDGRVTVVPRTHFTEDDSTRGFSWATDIDLYMATVPTVGSFTVRSNRLTDLAGQPTNA